MGLLKLKSCLCFELKIGVMAIGIFLSVLAVLQAIFAIVTMIVRIISGLSGGIHIICATVQFISNIFLLIGCSTFKKNFVLQWLVIYGMADFAYLMLGLVMLGMGVKVWDGSPQVPFFDERVVTMTGIIAYDYWTSGYVALIVGPILIVASGILGFFWLVGLSHYRRMGHSSISHP